MKKFTIGVDLGGTKIHGILVREGRIAERIHLEHEKKTREAVLEALFHVIETLSRRSGPRGVPVGIGVPSPLDRAKEILLNPPNIISLKGCHLARWLGKRLRLPVKLENDARCFALGEALSRRGKRGKSLVGITLGTGVGGGVVADGKLWNGIFGSAGEIGHMVIAEGGALCGCGRAGCLEAYASKKFFVRESGRDPKEVEEAARRGEKAAQSLYRRMGHYLGLGIASIVNIIDPGLVVLGGRISRAAPFFLPEAKKTARTHIISPNARLTRIEVSRNVADSVALGAASLFR